MDLERVGAWWCESGLACERWASLAPPTWTALMSALDGLGLGLCGT